MGINSEPPVTNSAQEPNSAKAHRSDVLSAAIHDLKSPIQQIYGYYKMARESGAISEEEIILFQKIENSFNPVLEIVKDLGDSTSGIRQAVLSPELPESQETVINFLAELKKQHDSDSQNLSIEEIKDSLYSDLVTQNQGDLFSLICDQSVLFVDQLGFHLENSQETVSKNLNLRVLPRLTEKLKNYFQDSKELFQNETLVPEFKNFSVQQVIGEISELHQNPDSLKIEISNPDGIDVINSDPRIIKKVIDNIVGNAVKYGINEANLPVIIDLKEDGENVVISVTDHGIGLDPRDLPKMNQADSRPGRNLNAYHFPGTGFGLWMCRSLIHKIGGEITADSPGLNQGSTFTVRFPTNPLLSVS